MKATTKRRPCFNDTKKNGWGCEDNRNKNEDELNNWKSACHKEINGHHYTIGAELRIEKCYRGNLGYLRCSDWNIETQTGGNKSSYTNSLFQRQRWIIRILN